MSSDLGQGLLSYLPILLGLYSELGWPGQQVLDRRLQLVTVGKQGEAAKYVETQPGAAHCDHKPPYISQMAHCPGSDQ